MALYEKYFPKQDYNKRPTGRTGRTIEWLPIAPGTLFSEVWSTVESNIFNAQPKDVYIRKGNTSACISANTVEQVACMEHVDRKRAIDAVAYACWDADTVTLVEPDPDRERIPTVNTPFKKFIQQNRPALSYLDRISGKKRGK